GDGPSELALRGADREDAGDPARGEEAGEGRVARRGPALLRSRRAAGAERDEAGGYRRGGQRRARPRRGRGRGREPGRGHRGRDGGVAEQRVVVAELVRGLRRPREPVGQQEAATVGGVPQAARRAGEKRDEAGAKRVGQEPDLVEAARARRARVGEERAAPED